MPDWKIVEWDETNYDVTKAAYVREAYEARMWAFVSDYARFDILREHGGIYLDTDVELLKPIPDWALRDDGFTGMEASGLVSPGLIFACIPNHASVSAIMDSYNRSSFSLGGKRGQPETVNRRVTAILERYGFNREDVAQSVAGIKIYPSEYFCGYDQDLHEPRITSNTISRHHYAHTWGSSGDGRRVRTQRAIRALLGERGYRRLLAVKRGLFGVRGA